MNRAEQIYVISICRKSSLFVFILLVCCYHLSWYTVNTTLVHYEKDKSVIYRKSIISSLSTAPTYTFLSDGVMLVCCYKTTYLNWYFAFHSKVVSATADRIPLKCGHFCMMQPGTGPQENAEQSRNTAQNKGQANLLSLLKNRIYNVCTKDMIFLLVPKSNSTIFSDFSSTFTGVRKNQKEEFKYSLFWIYHPL